MTSLQSSSAYLTEASLVEELSTTDSEEVV